jgi:hypothetical protein
LPAHSSHITQPLDVGVFSQTKTIWKKILSEYYADPKHTCISKTEFPSLINKIVNEGGFKRSYLVDGFEATGLYPINKDKAVDRWAYLKETNNDEPEHENNDDSDE